MLNDVMIGLVAAVAIVAFLATVAEGIVEGFIAPLFKRYGLDEFWLFYIAWGVVIPLVILSRVNLFESFIPADSPALAWFGRALTAIIAGRGANYIHDLFSIKRNQAIASGFHKDLLDARWRDKHIVR